MTESLRNDSPRGGERGGEVVLSSPHQTLQPEPGGRRKEEGGGGRHSGEAERREERRWKEGGGSLKLKLHLHRKTGTSWRE